MSWALTGIANWKGVDGANIRHSKIMVLPLTLFNNVDKDGSPQIYLKLANSKWATNEMDGSAPAIWYRVCIQKASKEKQL